MDKRNEIHTAESHELKAVHLQTGYDAKVIIEDMNLVIPDHKISVIIGSNGCGKSTLLKTFARLLKPMKGEVLLDGKPYDAMSSKELARKIGLLPQSPLVPEGVKVSDLVSRGRYPYQEAFRGLQKEDYEAVDEAMEMMGVSEFADRNVDELSGGQRQRVWIAMALAQSTDILFLDEPTTYLDITYQVEILDLLTELNQKRKTTIVMVLHDLNLSARYADYLFALKDGSLKAQGTPEEVISEELIQNIFGLDCLVMKDPVSGSPFIVPKGRYHRAFRETAE
ncbi:MAG TPA: cobalamin/Fe(3+)-siderophore ABC transporter ATP-binding protein [Erysipelotrichaceae bacterium]|nr:cobalamin/Fe(3+)-siderophore ABC transporter ATP-binding protein [Erysipelotrichaceae bacterium]HCK89431.1 cobalamin/Fe(3+)-siderophore ABC transporter ATP-binding protein [Erysipelotrichaceae bacterium]